MNKINKSALMAPRNLRILLLLMTVFLNFSSTIYSQNTHIKGPATRILFDLETDPLTWKGVFNNSQRFDAKIVFRMSKVPHMRFGLIGYAGKWDSKFGRDLILTKDFPESNWVVTHNGVGAETQYRFGFGSERGGLLPGVRVQWNQFKYQQNKAVKGEANHLALMPQLGYQWFPFEKIGFYFLPWTGVQLPVVGTNRIVIDGVQRETRKVIPWVTVLIGWEFKF